MESKADQTVVAEKATTVAYLPNGFSLGSRKVEIRLVDQFSLIPKNMPIRAEFTKKIGSGFKKGTKDIIRGLGSKTLYVAHKSDGSIDYNDTKFVNEQEKYLAGIVGVQPGSNEWEATIKEYWANFSIEVTEMGVELEIGFDETGAPLSLEGYINYNMCKENGRVAVTDEELENKSTFLFYVIDKGKKKEEERKRFLAQQQGDLLFFKITNPKAAEDKIKIDYILEIAGGKEGHGILNASTMDPTDKLMALSEIKDNRLEKFVELANDPNLATKALLRKAVTYRAIDKEGNSYFIADKKIGSTEKEAIGYLNDAINQGVRAKIVENINAAIK